MIIGQRDILLKIASLLKKYKIPYLLTGSFAVSYYGFPRATHDINFVIEIASVKAVKILDALGGLGKGFDFGQKSVIEAVENFSQFDVFHFDTGIKIDFWINKKDEFGKNKFKRKKIISINRQKIPAVSAEDLILTKLTWCKEIRSDRHLRDCTGIIKTQQKTLDRKYLARWARKLDVEKLLAEAKTMDYGSY